jgi:hypothetical protein
VLAFLPLHFGPNIDEPVDVEPLSTQYFQVLVKYARYRVGTFHECLADCIKTLREFCDGFEYQIQFEDQQMLATVEWEWAGLFRLANNCLSRERCFQLNKIFVANEAADVGENLNDNERDL